MFLCDNIFNYYDRLSCASALKNHYFDAKACGVCQDIFSDPKKVTCIKTIAHKYYTNFEIKLCTDGFYDDQKISCLKENGTHGNPYPTPTGNCDFSKLKRQIDGAIQNFNGGNHQAGMNTLYNIKSELARCSK